MTPTEALASLGLTISAVFVPFSLSRDNGKTNGRPLWKSLNWTVTLLRNDKPILTTDYGSGIANCPGHKKPHPAAWDRPTRFWIEAVTDWEIETGYQAGTWTTYGGFSAARRPATEAEIADGKRDRVRIAITPKPEDVWYSMMVDLVEEPFEDWCANFGSDPDSIKAKALYDLCVDHTMRIRSHIGAAGIETLREAFQDY